MTMDSSETKNMIFHMPIKIDTDWHSGSQIRPQKMIEAFENIGYRVSLIVGNVKERKRQIVKIKKDISKGVKYDFVYSESSTEPTALTESHHFPVAPFFDFNFLKFCKNNNIKVSLFYRDIYWKLDSYRVTTSYLKGKIAKAFYKYDLIKYKECVDILYVPSMEMYKFMKYEFNNKVSVLPPGATLTNNTEKDAVHEKLNLIYVGGLGDNYDLKLFLSVISSLNEVQFNLCIREREWSNCKYSQSLKNTTVYHKQGEGLVDLYNKSDIAIYFIRPNQFGLFAMGLKLFEYISHLKPIIAVKGSAVGNFVERYDIGWVIEYREGDLKSLITSLQRNSREIDNKIKNIKKIISSNTWNARALQVQKELIK
jgi:glycosyltransferase involved in cell wall biosynthesis